MAAEGFATLARDTNVFVRHAAAWNAATPPDLLAILAILAGDTDAGVRRRVAESPATLLEDLWVSSQERPQK